MKEHIYLGGFEVYREYGGDGTTVTLERETLHVMDDEQRIALVETRTDGVDGSPERVIRYQLGNHLGSVSLELDDAAKIISYEEYYPYGSTSYQAFGRQNETPKRYRYTGKERDEESGFHYHGSRYCANWLGRWISADPIGIADGLNLYQYAQSTPTQLVDASGTQGRANYLFSAETEGGLVANANFQTGNPGVDNVLFAVNSILNSANLPLNASSTLAQKIAVVQDRALRFFGTDVNEVMFVSAMATGGGTAAGGAGGLASSKLARASSWASSKLARASSSLTRPVRSANPIGRAVPRRKTGVRAGSTGGASGKTTGTLDSPVRIDPGVGNKPLRVKPSNVTAKPKSGPRSTWDEAALVDQGMTRRGVFPRSPFHHKIVQQILKNPAVKKLLQEQEIDIDDFAVQLCEGEHSAIHTMGFNPKWQAFFEQALQRKLLPTKDEILEFMTQMSREYKIDQLLTQRYPGK